VGALRAGCFIDERIDVRALSFGRPRIVDFAPYPSSGGGSSDCFSVWGDRPVGDLVNTAMRFRRIVYRIIAALK